MFGLKPSDIDLIVATIQRHFDVEEAIVYGSRAMGNYKPGSDVDIALKGTLEPNTSTSISFELNEHLPLPYMFDIVNYSILTHQPLVEQIDLFGKSLYKRTQNLR